MTHTKTGLCLPTQAVGIASDVISTVITTRRIAVKNKTFVLCDNNIAYGEISFTMEPQQLNMKAFKNNEQHHGITDEKRKAVMKNRRVFYAYDFNFRPFAETKRVLCVNDSLITKLSYIGDDEKTYQSNGRNGAANGSRLYQRARHELETDFKLLTQKGNGKTEYHLLIKMPTRFIDFVFDHKPRREFEAEKRIAKTTRWSTTGDISARHELNTTGETNKIHTVDSGKAVLDLDGDNQKIVLKLNGNKYKQTLTATRKQKTDTWNMEMI